MDSPDPMILDVDFDGVLDENDNCIDAPNLDQADEDDDGRGDVCDNCPHIDNADQANADGDLVGNVCDPDETAANMIRFFEPFNDPAQLAIWSRAGSNSAYEIRDGALRQTGDSDLALAWRNDLDLASAIVTTRVTYDDLVSTSQSRAAGVLTRFQRDPVADFGTGMGCGSVLFNGVVSCMSYWQTGGGFRIDIREQGGVISIGSSAQYSTRSRSRSSMDCDVDGSSYSADFSPGTIDPGTGTGVCLMTRYLKASFAYVIAIE